MSENNKKFELGMPDMSSQKIEERKLTRVWENFGRVQLDRLMENANKRGWDNEDYQGIFRKRVQEISDKIVEGEAVTQDYLDLANYSMFLWNIEKG